MTIREYNNETYVSSKSSQTVTNFILLQIGKKMVSVGYKCVPQERPEDGRVFFLSAS
jgi:hypothetical protein